MRDEERAAGLSGREPKTVAAALASARGPMRRREGDREVPAGPKARKTRQILIDTARDLFSQNGYFATSVSDIVDAAGVSFGTYYQYFRGRAAVLEAIVHEAVAVMVSRAGVPWTVSDGRDGLHRVVRNFVVAYQETQDAVRIWDEAAHGEESMRVLRRDLARMFTQALTDELLEGGRAGLCRKFSGEEAELAARALLGMVEHFCHVNYVLDPPDVGPPNADRAARVLTDLFSSGIGLADDRPGAD